MLIKMFGAAPEAGKGRRPGGFGGDPSIFAPCSLDLSRRAKQAVGNKNLACCGEGRNCGHEKSPARFPARAQLVSFNFTSNLIRAIASRDLKCRVVPQFEI
jgi:hypothetical protein